MKHWTLNSIFACSLIKKDKKSETVTFLLDANCPECIDFWYEHRHRFTDKVQQGLEKKIYDREFNALVSS